MTAKKTSSTNVTSAVLGSSLQHQRELHPQQNYDSDDHDDFNPIKDLMPPSIVGVEIDLIGKKRMRDKDPLLRLVEESASEEAGVRDGIS